VKLLAISYPELSDKELNLIENYREKNGILFPIARPHFTFVLAVDDFTIDDIGAEVKSRRILI
jgi:hypothetical protein